VYFELENRTWRQHFLTNALRKNSCIGKKCRNDVQKFTPTKKFPGEFRISGGIFPPAVCLEETLSERDAGLAERQELLSWDKKNSMDRRCPTLDRC